MARKARKARDPELFDVEAGRRMIAFFDKARVNLDLDTDAELWRRLQVSRDTAQSWMRGERPPSREVGERVARRLGMSYADLLGVYYGERQEIDPATVIAALEWAISMVRAGGLPEGSLEPSDAERVDEIEQAARLSATRRPFHQPGGRTRERRSVS